MTPKEICWCGEGDLNPHEIAPASTSSAFWVFRSHPERAKWLILRERPFHCGLLRPGA